MRSEAQDFRNLQGASHKLPLQREDNYPDFCIDVIFFTGDVKKHNTTEVACSNFELSLV